MKWLRVGLPSRTSPSRRKRSARISAQASRERHRSAPGPRRQGHFTTIKIRTPCPSTFALSVTSDPDRLTTLQEKPPAGSCRGFFVACNLLAKCDYRPATCCGSVKAMLQSLHDGLPANLPNPTRYWIGEPMKAPWQRVSLAPPFLGT